LFRHILLSPSSIVLGRFPISGSMSFLYTSWRTELLDFYQKVILPVIRFTAI
jgi:hypothetical protein